MKIRPTHNQLMRLAVASVERVGDLSLYWKCLHEARRSIDFKTSEAKEFEAQNCSEIYRRARKPVLDSGPGYESASFASRMVEGGALDGVRTKRIGIAPLAGELSDYMSLIKPKPSEVWLLEAVCAVRDLVVLQPLFKVVAVYGRGRVQSMQLMILGRDRHTREPFALGVPNGFVDFPIDVALRWTMDVHLGDTVEEV